VPVWKEVTNGEVSDFEYRDFLNSAARLGFSQRIEPRTANSHRLGRPTSQQVEDLLAVSPDFAEFIVPVFWSRQEFVGAIPRSTSDELTLVKQGHELISGAGVAEASRMPPIAKPPAALEYRRFGKSKASEFQVPVGFYDPWNLDYMSRAYVDGTIRGTALQTATKANVRRQGWLLVGRTGIVLMGLRTNLTPAMAFSMTYPHERFEDPRQAHFTIATHVPNDVEGCELYVEEFLKYEEIESISQVELVRFDGLAALLYMLHFAQSKQCPTPLLTRGSDIVNFSAFLEGLVGVYKKWVPDEFIPAAFERIHYGVNVANGTGVDSNGYPKLILFNSALGIAVQSAKNARKFFLESPFQELDAAVSLIESEAEAATTTTREIAETTGAAPQSSLASELERLAGLKQAGLLTDAEYSAAKSKLLS